MKAKKYKVREIEVVSSTEDDEATWLKRSLSKEAKRFIHYLLASQKRARKKGGDTIGASKRDLGLTKEQITAAERAIRARGERVTNKKLAKELGGKHPDYIRRRRKAYLS